MGAEKLGSGTETGLRRSGLVCSIWTSAVGLLVVLFAAILFSSARNLCLFHEEKWDCHQPFNHDYSVSLAGLVFQPPEQKAEGEPGPARLNKTVLALAWLFVVLLLLIFLAMAGLSGYFLWRKEEQAWARYVYLGLAGGLLLSGCLGAVSGFVFASSGITFKFCTNPALKINNGTTVCKVARPRVTSFVGGSALMIVGAILGALYGLFLLCLRCRRRRPPKPLAKGSQTPCAQPAATPLLLPEQRLVDVDIPPASLSSVYSAQGETEARGALVKSAEAIHTSSTASDSLRAQVEQPRAVDKSPGMWTPGSTTTTSPQETTTSPSPYDTVSPSSTHSTSQDPASPGSSKTPEEKASVHSFSSLIKPFLNP